MQDNCMAVSSKNIAVLLGRDRLRATHAQSTVERLVHPVTVSTDTKEGMLWLVLHNSVRFIPRKA
jgi:hypothetical protein